MFNITNIIKDYQYITIYRHVNPDCDALGSQFGLKYFIEDNFPNIKVKVLGNESFSKTIFDESDNADDEFIKKSLAIVLDTANKERVDDQRFLLAKKIIKIDHHPNNDDFGNENFVDTKYAATCEILTDAFINTNLYISIRTAKMLYRGLLTDTLSFKTTNTTSHTLLMAASLADKGINIPEINEEIFNDSLIIYQLKTQLRNKLIFDNKIAYAIYSQKEIEETGITAGDIRAFVSEIGQISDIEAWCIFTQKQGKELFDGSLRSKRITVNEIAMMYNGGGHKNASGVKNLSKNDINSLISQLKQEIVNYKNNT